MDELSKQILAGNIESSQVNITMENQVLTFTGLAEPTNEAIN
jgi:hypothetical protein